MNQESNSSKKYLNYFIEELKKNIEYVYLYEIIDKLTSDDIDKFLLEYEKSIDLITNNQLYINKIIKFALSYSKFEYIQHLVLKYNLNKFKSSDLYLALKNIDDGVFEYYLMLVNNLNSQDVLDAYCICDIQKDKLKLLLEITNYNYSIDEYFLLLRITSSYNNLENFKLVYNICKDLLDITKTFIAREEPLARFADSRDYSQPYECDLLLYSADLNSYHIIKYLLELGLFSSQSIEKAYNYAKSNPYNIRLQENKQIDNKDKTISILEKYLKTN